MRGLLIPLLFVVILILAVVVGAPASSDSSDPDVDAEESPLALTTKHDTAIVAAPDGTVYLVEIGSGKVLWSFSSGPSIYSSFQRIPDHEGEKLNASDDVDNFYIDCGDDWELYMHGNGLKKVKFPLSVEEFIKRTPFVLSGGGVMLGSKKTSVFLVDAKTGKVVRSFRSENLPVVDEVSNLTKTDLEQWQASDSMDDGDIENPLYVTRTDYALKYTSMKTGEVLWYLMFADVEASFQCEGIQDFFSGSSTKLPMHCQKKPIVYRIRDRSSLESLFATKKSQAGLPGGGVLSLPASASDDHAIQLVEKFFNKDIMFALPTSGLEEFITKGLPGSVAPPMISQTDKSDSLAQPHLWYSICSTLLLIGLTFIGLVVKRRGGSHKQSERLKLQTPTSKKKKTRKSSVNRHNNVVGQHHEENSQVSLTSVLEGIEETKRSHAFFHVNDAEVRHIGKLIVTNKEIAKGSNGTIVLEGYYEGRSVAVKRLVRTHHNVAVKEIQNLIASDQHPNIVRWYGVEYDKDFVYICLERCACSLYDLISFCCNGEITTADQDHESLSLKRSNMQLVVNLGSDKELELWKTNGYPSPCLLKLMRDVVCGVVHLHELGIIHRDLKPQNVLVIKDRLLSAKISDMGISKHLDGDMSSLTKHATGYGSSGWQAPEQLRHERQTRAVDLFSLGCVLFFCMTGGKHPFGENLERDVNIVHDRKDLFLIDHIPEAADLISRLLNSNPNARPKAVEVINHPLFWNSEMRLSFLRDVSDRVELEDRKDSSELLEALENCAKVALGGKWDEKMDNAFMNDIGRYRRYKFDSVRDLLRVIRNKLNHYRELPDEVQEVLGSLPEGFDAYFSTRFPKLLIEVYHVILVHCSEEETFGKYFRTL